MLGVWHVPVHKVCQTGVTRKGLDLLPGLQSAGGAAPSCAQTPLDMQHLPVAASLTHAGKSLWSERVAADCSVHRLQAGDASRPSLQICSAPSSLQLLSCTSGAYA